VHLATARMHPWQRNVYPSASYPPMYVDHLPRQVGHRDGVVWIPRRLISSRSSRSVRLRALTGNSDRSQVAKARSEQSALCLSRTPSRRRR
jgi:hypothetical protein